jgi:hypothetical protein
MKAQNVFEGMKNLFGALAIVLSMWAAMLTAFSVGSSVVIMLHADGYRPAVCTIDELFFQRGEIRSNRTYSDYYAGVTVEGQKEEFNLGDYIKGVPQTREDLEAQVQVGQRLDVLYNPDVPRNSQLRVLYPEKNFKQTWKNRQKRMIQTAYGPWILAIGLCLLFGAAARKIRSAVKMSIGACIFVILAWIPYILNHYF